MRKVEEFIHFLDSPNQISVQESFEIATFCSANSDGNEIDSRRLAINVLNNWQKFPKETLDLWSSILESLGFYPYIEKESLELSGLSEGLRNASSQSRYLSGKYLHDGQQELTKLLYSGKNVIASAPTSFGKSLLIEEVVASKIHRNIVIIQPTLALLDETRKKLLK